MPSTFPALTAAGLGTFTFAPLPDVSPFTIRSGATYESIQYSIYTWLRDDLVPYLTDHSAEATFQDAIDTLTDLVNTALGDQASTVNAALNQAVQEVVTADIPITAALFESMGVYIAPPPSGGDDTAVLQPLLLAAQATSGTLVLRAGTYLANLATVQSTVQPRIVGQGKDHTTLQGFTSASPVLRLKGGSGALSGGFLADFTIRAAAAGGGIGLQLADCCGVKWTRLRIRSTLDEAIQFLSESAGAFCEFNCGDVEITSGPVLPVHYKKISGNESFHGSGLTKGSVINQSTTATSPMIVIDDGCFPYAAPLDVAVFPKTSNTSVIRNNNTARSASFQGNIDIEVQNNAANVNICDTASARGVYLQGGIVGLITGTALKLGKLYLADRVYYIGGNTFVQRKPYKEVVPLTAGTTPLNISSGTSLMQVDIIASNYHYSYLLHCWQSPYDPTGVVTQLANPKSLNTAGLGAPSFTWANSVLQITNPAYSSAVVAHVKVTPMENTNSLDTMANY